MNANDVINVTSEMSNQAKEMVLAFVAAGQANGADNNAVQLGVEQLVVTIARMVAFYHGISVPEAIDMMCVSFKEHAREVDEQVKASLS